MEVNQSVLSRQFIEVSFIKVFYRRTSIREIQQVFHYINTVHIQPRRCVPQSIIVSSQGKCNTVSLEKRDYLFLLFL